VLIGGTPVPDARVWVRGDANTETLTDRSGRFEIRLADGVRRGTLLVRGKGRQGERDFTLPLLRSLQISLEEGELLPSFISVRPSSARLGAGRVDRMFNGQNLTKNTTVVVNKTTWIKIHTEKVHSPDLMEVSIEIKEEADAGEVRFTPIRLSSSGEKLIGASVDFVLDPKQQDPKQPPEPASDFLITPLPQDGVPTGLTTITLLTALSSQSLIPFVREGPELIGRRWTSPHEMELSVRVPTEVAGSGFIVGVRDSVTGEEASTLMKVLPTDTRLPWAEILASIGTLVAVAMEHQADSAERDYAAPPTLRAKRDAKDRLRNNENYRDMGIAIAVGGVGWSLLQRTGIAEGIGFRITGSLSRGRWYVGPSTRFW